MSAWRRIACAAALILGLADSCQLQAATTVSSSRQFIIHSLRPGATTLNRLGESTDSERISLHPDLVAVGCERIKRAVLSDLRLRDAWRGKVHVRLYPGSTPGMRPRLGATRFSDGWQYSISTPDELEPAVFVRAVVTTLLLELANRVPGPHPAEVPVWLAEGMTAEVLTRVWADLVPAQSPLLSKIGGTWGQLEMGSKVMIMGGHQENIMAMLSARGELPRGGRVQVTGEARERTRALIRAHGALTFRELSFPGPQSLRGDARVLYRASAEVLLLEFRRLPGGEAMLLDMLERLTSHLNWQTAFLQAFSTGFRSLLEVEKWWAMASFQFSVGQSALSWTSVHSIRALADALAVTLEVRAQARAAPRRERTTLQAALTRLNPEQANAVLQQKSRQLAMLQTSMAPEVALLCQEYRDAVDGRYVSLGAIRATRLLIDRFDALDAQRTQLQQSIAAKAAAGQK